MGDRLKAAQWRKLRAESFCGNDVDPEMVSLASVNVALRGVPDVRILERNVLTTSFDRQAKAENNLSLDGHAVKIGTGTSTVPTPYLRIANVRADRRDRE